MDGDVTGSVGAALFRLDGFRVLSAAEVGGELEMLVETTAELVGCPECGAVARPKDRRPVWVRDLPIGGRPVVQQLQLTANLGRGQHPETVQPEQRCNTNRRGNVTFHLGLLGILDCLVVITDRESPRPLIRSFQPGVSHRRSPTLPGSWRRAGKAHAAPHEPDPEGNALCAQP